LHVLFLQARQVRANDQLVLPLENLDSGNPQVPAARTDRRGAAWLHPSAAETEFVEDAIHLVGEPCDQTSRLLTVLLPAGDCRLLTPCRISIALCHMPLRIALASNDCCRFVRSNCAQAARRTPRRCCRRAALDRHYSAGSGR